MKDTVKKTLIEVILSLFIIFVMIISSDFIATKIIIKNQFFMQRISEIKSYNSVLYKFERLLKKDSRSLMKKYMEAVTDSFIEFDQLPSFDDLKYFPQLLINSLESGIKIKKIEIRNNKMILMCESNDVNSINKFINEIKNTTYVDNLFYSIYEKNNKIKTGIFCVHNSKINQ